jgi:succinate-semialdehyde dehydrogenase/glutarate-semialdehyde dehydrogenase
MPWNFPFWQALRCAVPITLAGNSFVLKHAPNTLACADAIEKLFLEAGFPVGSFQHVRMSIPEVHDWIASPMIAGVTFTGSTMVGSKIAESAGRHLKKVVLELGGSDPFIVCADADIELAAEEAVKARFQNCGQSCIAAKRFFVHASVCETFLKEFSSKASQIVVGDPTKKETYLSCMARVGLRQNLQKIVRDSVALGANVYWQHQDVFDHDNFYAPTILANVSKEMPVYSQEVFGPVASVLSFSDYEQVVEQANDTDFGLGASVWTKNADLAERIMAGVDSGSVTHNSVLHSHPAVPFGGIKKSGIGRELGDWGVWEFANHKVYHF